MGLNTALSGILGAQSDLNVISNNIANTNTTGFKASRAEFGDIFSSTAYNLSTVGVGSGTRLTDTAQLFNQGDIESTGNSLDVAIDGNGFFTLNTGNGYAYTRAGNFHTNSSGDVINAEGYNLQVYAPGATEGTFDTSHLINLSIPTSEGAAQATTSAKIVANLPSGASTPTTTPFNADDSSSYNNTTTFTAYDSQGQTHAVTMYYVKTGTNSWQAHAVIDGKDITPANGLDLAFNSNGQLSSPSSGKLALGEYAPTNGASPVNITLDMSGSTQYGTAYSAGTVSQDGYQAGTLASIDIGSDGIVTANYSNGQDTQVGQLAMANFTNQQGLAQVGNTNWKATSSSGQAIMGTANSGQFGDLQSGSLESSTTADTTAQLVAMIQAQQAYQANAQVLSTTNTLTSTLMSAISR